MSDVVKLGPVGNVFYFVDDLQKAAAWYAARLGRKPVVQAQQLIAFDMDGVRLTVHQRDELNSPGPAGVSAYWNVDNVDAIVSEWVKYGATPHRGPKTVFTGERLCQLLDPFGNLFSIRQAPPATALHKEADASLTGVTALPNVRVPLQPSVEDRLRIAELVTEADACATRRDADAYVSLFTEFGIMDGDKGDFCGPHAIKDAVLQVWATEPQETLHVTTMISIVSSKQVGEAVAWSTLLTIAHQPPQLLAATRVRQDVRLVSGQWRIARRTIG